LQLCQQGGDGLIAGLVDPAGGNQLVNLALEILSAHSRQRSCWYIEKIEVVGDVQPDISRVGVAHLKYFQIEHHFRPLAIQLREELGCGF